MKRIHFVKLLLVAVLATSSVNALGETEELTSEELIASVTNETCAYTTEKSYADGTVSYTFYVYTDAAKRPWVQLKKDKGVYIKIGSPINTVITSIDIVITSVSNSSGGIADISKHTAFSGTVALHTADTTGAANMKGVAATTSISNNKATLSPIGNNNTLYLKVSAGARIWGIIVTYSSSGSGETTNYTVQWMVGGAKYTEGNPTTEVASGSKVTTLPTAPADNRLSCAEKFMGWSTTNIGATPQSDAPEILFTTAENSPNITANTTFYAVFATKQTN